MDAEDILDGLIRGALGSGRKRSRGALRVLGGGGSLINARTLLAAAGVAWGLYEASHKPAAPPPIPGAGRAGGELICQKDSFLCAAKGVSIGIAFQKRIGVGLFGGEGFIMQRLTGDGLCFIHAGGMLTSLDLAPGELLRLDTGCLVALQPSVSYDIQFVGNVKTALFGGEGIFFAALTGPGRSGSSPSPSAASRTGSTRPRRRQGAAARRRARSSTRPSASAG
jgi:hypothetical protein